MKFWDSSAIVPLLVEEPTSRQCRDLQRADPALVVWQFTETEVVSALHKQTRMEPPLSKAELDAALHRLRGHVRRWEQVKALGEEALVAVRKRAAELMSKHTLHAGDALQLTAALIRFDPPMKRDFVVFDGFLARAAAKEGFNVIVLPPTRGGRRRR